MKNTKRKGFTIVELVIVIAVIAILAAVLIPTFASLVNKANKSKDTQLVKNLNTALASDAKEHKTMGEALAAAEEFGYDVAKINASATGNEILWDSANDVFCYFNGEKIEYIPEASLKVSTPEPTDYWQICKTMPETQKYSIYWAGEDDQTLALTVGFDAGQTTGHTVTYTGTAKGTVIRTNGGTLTVNDEQADVHHYGSAKEVTITACATESYHEFGQVVKMSLTKGHIVIEKGGYVDEITEKGSGTVTNDQGGYISKVPESSGIAQGDADSYSLEISTAAELASFRDGVNMGLTYSGLTVKLTADIDLGAYANWNPIGNRYTEDDNGAIVDWDKGNESTVRRIFKGTFDGQGHTISGMTINSLADNYEGLRADNTSNDKSSYAALFGYISGATLKNFTVSGTVVGVDVAGVVGITGDVCTIDNVVSNVALTGKYGTNEENLGRGKVAGFVCCPKGSELTIKDCTNNGDLTSNENCGGFIAYIGGSYAESMTVTMENCVNTGKMTNKEGACAGLIANIQVINGSKSVTIKNCKNTGDIFGIGGKGNDDKHSRAGGLVGFCSLEYNAEGSVVLTVDDKCQNTGKVQNTTNDSTYDNFCGSVWNQKNDGSMKYNGASITKPSSTAN